MPRMPGEKFLKQRQKANSLARSDQYKKYDYFERNKETVAMYNSTAWKKVRNLYIAKHPLCEVCTMRGFVTIAREIHHRVPLSEGGSLLEESNLQALCHSCHMQIHGFKGKGDTEINVVYGAPCSGKTTWVEKQFKPGDFVWDMDKVISATMLLPDHADINKAQLYMVLAMRDAVIEQLKRKDCTLTRAWVIITDPTKLRKVLHMATFWEVKASLEVCLVRAKKDKRSKDVIAVIHEWFNVLPRKYGDRTAEGW